MATPYIVYIELQNTQEAQNPGIPASNTASTSFDNIENTNQNQGTEKNIIRSMFFIEFSRYTPYQFMQERQKCKKRQKMHVKFQKSCRIFLDLLEIELSLCGES